MYSPSVSRHFRGVLAPLAVLGTVLLTAPLKAWAYGADGHELVADVAESYLQRDEKGQAVLTRIKTILAPDETMARASTWADRIKSRERDDDPDAQDTSAFLAKVQAKFGNTRAHGTWHYVDVPFQLSAYSRDDAWTRPDDVVQMIRICAQTLRDGASPADAPVELSPREALRLLIHYVGDEHQPLHVGSGYLAKDGMEFVVPTAADLEAGKVVDDQGGNSLTITVNGTPMVDDRGRPVKLHSYWDSNTVRTLLNGQHVSDYEPTLLAIAPTPDWDGVGEMKDWSKQWADDTLRQSKSVYGGLTITGKEERGWDIALPTNYDQTSSELVKTELAMGGYRLAQILKASLGAP